MKTVNWNYRKLHNGASRSTNLLIAQMQAIKIHSGKYIRNKKNALLLFSFSSLFRYGFSRSIECFFFGKFNRYWLWMMSAELHWVCFNFLFGQIWTLLRENGSKQNTGGEDELTRLRLLYFFTVKRKWFKYVVST